MSVHTPACITLERFLAESRYMVKDAQYEYPRWHTYWESVVDEVERECGQIGEWANWIPGVGDGLPLPPVEYRSMADGYSSKLKRTYRIDQNLDVESEDAGMLQRDDQPLSGVSAWVSRYPPNDPLFPPLCLTIQVSDPLQQVGFVRALLRRWMDPELDDQSIKQFVKDLE